LIQNIEHYPFVVKYLYRNAPEAGLCERVEDYPYSTLGAYFGFHRCGIRISMDPLFQKYPISSDPSFAKFFLDWLNTPYKQPDSKAVGDALNRKDFRFHKVSKHKRYCLSEMNFGLSI